MVDLLVEPNAVASRGGGEFGAFVRRHRHLRGWTQQQLAGAVGISREYVASVETGRSGLPAQAVIASLARELQVPPEALLRAAGYLPPEATAAEGSPGYQALSWIHRDPRLHARTKAIIESLITADYRDWQARRHKPKG